MVGQITRVLVFAAIYACVTMVDVEADSPKAMTLESIQTVPLQTMSIGSITSNTKCQKEAAKGVEAAKKKMVGGYYPTCDSKGDYTALQASGGTGLSWCADKNGAQLTTPARGSLTEKSCQATRTKSKKN